MEVPLDKLRFGSENPFIVFPLHPMEVPTVIAQPEGIPIASLQARYNVASDQTIRNRAKYLGHEIIKGGLVPVEALEELDELDRHLQQPRAKLADFVPRYRSDKSIGSSIASTGSTLPASNGSSIGSTGQIPIPYQLVLELLDRLQQQPSDPLSPQVQLQRAHDNEWKLTSEQVKAITGSYPRGQAVEAYGFRLSRCGKSGRQSLWEISVS